MEKKPMDCFLKIYEANLNQTLPEWSLDGVKSDAKYVIHLTYIYLDTKM